MTSSQLQSIDVAGHTQSSRKSLMAKFADRYSVDPQKMMETLKSTAFRQKDGTTVSDEQMMALIVVADQYGLNPFTKEIYAFPDKSGIVPVVGVDGWSRIINQHPQFDGMEFSYSDEKVTPEGAESPCHEWIDCVMYRKDRARATVVREYLDEVYRKPFKQGMKGPWQTHPKRFLRHKATIQCARLAFGFVGIYDQDEAERIVEKDVTPAAAAEPAPREPYPEGQFTTNLPRWREVIESGKKSADQIISMVESKAPLTDDQKQRIRDLEIVEGETE